MATIVNNTFNWVYHGSQREVGDDDLEWFQEAKTGDVVLDDCFERCTLEGLAGDSSDLMVKLPDGTLKQRTPGHLQYAFDQVLRSEQIELDDLLVADGGDELSGAMEQNSSLDKPGADERKGGDHVHLADTDLNALRDEAKEPGIKEAVLASALEQIAHVSFHKNATQIWFFKSLVRARTFVWVLPLILLLWYT